MIPYPDRNRPFGPLSHSPIHPRTSLLYYTITCPSFSRSLAHSFFHSFIRPKATFATDNERSIGRRSLSLSLSPLRKGKGAPPKGRSPFCCSFFLANFHLNALALSLFLNETDYRPFAGMNYCKQLDRDPLFLSTPLQCPCLSLYVHVHVPV